MNATSCEIFYEWMSLAQDGLLSSAQNQLLHEHLASCPECKVRWDAMTFVSHALRSAPMLGPQPGFVARFQARLAYRQEQQRRLMVALLLGVGVIALTLLALPSILGVLGLTGRLLLPYWLVAYAQSAFNWFCHILTALSDAVWLVVRNFATTSSGTACITTVIIAAAALFLGVPLVVGRMATRPSRR